MRPGPGLVVMALAFLSGARQGFSQQTNPNNIIDNEPEDRGALARINPWLSACDLAQPNAAPDLQGQCLAGISPVAWVNEGPGPPECLPSCENYSEQINVLNNQQFNKMGNSYNENKKQCLHYLGDNGFKLEQLCDSGHKIVDKLKTLHLRHCCERTTYTALKDQDLDTVRKGGSACVKILQDLMETDALAARITCEFTEILVRYDCRQKYSIIHGCRDCKEAYRRWVCSTLIPFFAENGDIIENMENISPIQFNENSTMNINRNVRDVSTNVKPIKNPIPGNKSIHHISDDNNREISNTNLVKSIEDPIVSKLLSRSRRKVETIRKRKRIRPCLTVCQTVERYCPYMLPGDRAPSHPTQYAGEPTFLCLDLNIPEMGEQSDKSDIGTDDCCYWYCGGVGEGLCTVCETFNDTSLTGDDLMADECQSVSSGVSTVPKRCNYLFTLPATSAASSILHSDSHWVQGKIQRSFLALLNDQAKFQKAFAWTISWYLIGTLGGLFLYHQISLL